jgi:hypothetical protein
MSKASTRHVNLAQMQYHVSFHDSLTVKNLSLIDRGANGGVAGSDVLVILRTNRTVDIKGIDNHHVNDIGIGTVGSVVDTQMDPVIVIIYQYALLGKGASIHYPSQLEWYKNDVFNGLLPWMATSFLLPLKIAWRVWTFGHINIMSMKPFVMYYLPPKLSGTPLSWTMSSLIHHKEEKTILKFLTSFLPLNMMNLANTVIALKLIDMCILHV